ncbi:MmcQ/YjbR family DNA-binding protein [Lactococcus fujiensis]|uniref:MmcQ/YjbR family DNA-binding protein n=1 Tax=Lactococcus fujiensis JCM 16395 TaxID=1291764 RepID=A0A2A5RKF6_9LACT|nr:MmcQ/YjbR family DNA-binding protein [Lactococcus fujiensis]PCR99675.1 hypothetical protein RT41_GL001788 [Lactococcus fujiensis JCM 16395]
MEKQELIDFCLSLGPTYVDYPFKKNDGSTDTTVVRHLKNKKIFALISERPKDKKDPLKEEVDLIIALKQKPELSEELRENFKAIEPAWHVNKTHWNDVYINSDMEDESIQKLISQSYELIRPKK